MSLITDYTSLQSEIAAYLNRSDLTSSIPGFIQRAEARFNRLIWQPQSEATDNQTTSALTLTVPADFRALKQIYVIVSSNKHLLREVTATELRDCYEGSTGQPSVFALVGDVIKFGPAPDQSYSYLLEYYQKIPPLASNSTNWLLTAHSDIYLYASLLHSEAFTWNDERLPLWKSALDEAMEELRQAGSRRARSANGPGLRSDIGLRSRWNVATDR